MKVLHQFKSSSLFIGVAVLSVGLACSSTENTARTPADYAGSCDVLASRCHGIASALATACHDLGHSGDDTKCGPKKNECLAVCPEGAHEEQDAGYGNVPDATTDATPDPTCVAYCSCMKSNCSSMTNYPFNDESTCFGACAVYSAQERSCFQSFCSEAADAGASAHACDHATGKLGVAECK